MENFRQTKVTVSTKKNKKDIDIKKAKEIFNNTSLHSKKHDNALINMYLYADRKLTQQEKKQKQAVKEEEQTQEIKEDTQEP
jgi:hypothetical protein